MPDWFDNFDDTVWLPPDSEGEEEAAFILRALRLRKDDRVLDAPCGAGRVTVHLAKAGCAVTGIDLRERFVRRARARFRAEGATGAFRAMDLRQLDAVDAFHGICNWLCSFGYFAEGENIDLLRRYVRALRPGGRLLIDQPNREMLLRHLQRAVMVRRVVVRNRWDAAMQRYETDWVSLRGGRRRAHHASVRLYTLRQMRRLFETAGLRVETVYGSLLGDRYTRLSPRMIFLGRKPR